MRHQFKTLYEYKAAMMTILRHSSIQILFPFPKLRMEKLHRPDIYLVCEKLKQVYCSVVVAPAFCLLIRPFSTIALLLFKMEFLSIHLPANLVEQRRRREDALRQCQNFHRLDIFAHTIV